jgi:hypothetical protein
MSDIVKRLRVKADIIQPGERVAWGSGSQLMREAAALIERQREALRVAREALVVGGVSDKFIEEALAAIDAALKETGGE